MVKNWKVGDIAICICTNPETNTSGNVPPLRLKAEYMVQGVRTCECGNRTLDVGIGINGSSKGVLCKCGACSSPKSGIWWCGAFRFVKKQEDSESKEEIEEQLELAIANEDYIKAAELNQKLQK